MVQEKGRKQLYRISKEFGFEAAHFLPDLPEGHPCKRLHGHSYRVRVELASDRLNEYGFVVDYGDLSPMRDYLANFDHHCLNDVLLGAATAERLANLIYMWAKSHWPQVQRVGVSETQKTWAWFGEEAHELPY